MSLEPLVPRARAQPANRNKWRWDENENTMTVTVAMRRDLREQGHLFISPVIVTTLDEKVHRGLKRVKTDHKGEGDPLKDEGRGKSGEEGGRREKYVQSLAPRSHPNELSYSVLAHEKC